MLLLLVVLLLLLGGGGYVGYDRWGTGGGISTVTVILIVLLVWILLGNGRHVLGF